jgi:hypothetical protein
MRTAKGIVLLAVEGGFEQLLDNISAEYLVRDREVASKAFLSTSMP